MAPLVTQTALLSRRGKTYTTSTASTTQSRHSVHTHSTSPLVRRGSGTSALSSQFSQQSNHRLPSTTTYTSTSSRSSGLSNATAAVLAQSQAALREAERIDAKYARLAAELNIQLPKPQTTRESTRDRQSRRPVLDMERRKLPDIASIPTSNRYAAFAAGIEEQTTDKTDIWVEIASSYATEDKSSSGKPKISRSRTNSTKTSSTQTTGASSSSSRRTQDLSKALRDAQDKSAAVDARIAEEATARALEKERDLEDQALRRINKPANQTFFEHHVAPILRSESPSSDVKPQPAKGAPANRNPRQILPSRGWEFAPQIQGRPKREARRQAATDAVPSTTTKSRNDLPSVSLPPTPSAPVPPSTQSASTISKSRDDTSSVSLPPRPSAPVPPSTRSASTTSESSSLSFQSVLSGTSMGRRSEGSITTSVSTKSAKTSPTSSNVSVSTASTSNVSSSTASESLPAKGAARRRTPPPIIPSRGMEIPPPIDGPPKRRSRQTVTKSEPVPILPSRGWEVPPQIEGPPKRRALKTVTATEPSSISNTGSNRTASSQVESDSSSPDRRLREMKKTLAALQQQHTEQEARIADEANARAQAEEKELEDQALRKIEQPIYQTFFEHQVAPHLRSESPSFGGVIFLQPAKSAPINRNPRQILPSCGWEFAPQIQGPAKRGARPQDIATAGSSTTSKSRNDLPSVSLPPRPSAPVPPSTRPSTRTASTSSTSSSLSFNSVLSGTSYGGRSEGSPTTSTRMPSSSTVNPRDESMSEIVIPRKRARQTSSTSTNAAISAIPEERSSATTSTRERSRTNSASSRLTSTSSLPEEQMSAISVPRHTYRTAPSTSRNSSRPTLPEEQMSYVLVPRQSHRITSSTSSVRLNSTLPEEQMSAISIPRQSYRTTSTTSSVNSSSTLPEEQMSAISVPRQSYRTSSSISRASSRSVIPEEQMSAISVPRQSYRTTSSSSSSSSSATSRSTLPEEQMSAISIPGQSYRTVSSKSSASASSTLLNEGMSMISVPRRASRTASSRSSVSSTSTLSEEGMSAISVPRQSYQTAPSSSNGTTRSRKNNWVEAAMRMLQEED